MLCVSNSARFRINHPDKEEVIYNPTTGRPMGKRRGLYAQFQPGFGMPKWAQDEVLRRFEFNGLPQGLEPLETIGWFDTEFAAGDQNWNAEELGRLEEFLRANDGAGYIILEHSVQVPYPQWEKHRRIYGSRRLEHVIRDVTAAYESAGFELDTAIAWEEAHEANPEVLEFLRGLSATSEPPAETVVAA